MFPTDVANQYYEAQRLFATGKAAQALVILDGIEHHAPNHPEIMHARALCLHAAGNLREALKVCNQLYTMHRDKRGQELRNRWTNPRWAADTTIRQDTSGEAETFSGQATQIVAAAAAEESPATLDAHFLREAAVLIMGLGADARPAPLTDASQLPARLKASGCTLADYNDALAQRHEACLPNAARLAAAARAAKLPLILLQWGFQCADGTDLSPHVYLRMRDELGDDVTTWPGHIGGAERLPAPDLATVASDHVLHMTGDDAFTSTNLRFVLHNLGVKNLVLAGGPVETALARTLATGKKRGFTVALATDATFAQRESLRLPSLDELAPAHAVDTTRLVALLGGLAPQD